MLCLGPERSSNWRMCPFQECVPENLELKQQLFAQLDQIVDGNVVLSSSSSCLLPSKLFAGLVHVRQCLVAHPVSVSRLRIERSPFGLGEQYVSTNLLVLLNCFIEL